eukprot:7386486-Prymnesium_polylepis.2
MRARSREKLLRNERSPNQHVTRRVMRAAVRTHCHSLRHWIDSGCARQLNARPAPTGDPLRTTASVVAPHCP